MSESELTGKIIKGDALKASSLSIFPLVTHYKIFLSVLTKPIGFQGQFP